MTSEKMVALLADATDAPWEVVQPTGNNPSRACVCAKDGFVEIYDAPLTRETKANAELIAAARNSLPALLAVAKAAKCYTNADPMVRGEAYRDLCEALARLEAQ